MSVAPSELYDRLVAAGSAVAGYSATTPWDLFDERGIRHKAFAVGLLDTLPAPSHRQGTAQGVLSTTTLEVVWCHLLRADQRVADYSTAVGDEVAFLQGLRDGFDETNVEPPQLVRLRRQVIDESQAALLTSATFSVVHFLPL